MVDSQMTCAMCKAGSASAFSGLCASDKVIVDNEKRHRRYSAGEMIFYAGDVANTLYCISSGHVKLYIVGPEGREQTVRLAQVGDIMGYRGIISGDGYEVFAMALDPVQLCAIPKQIFIDMLSRNSSFAVGILGRMAKELNYLEHTLLEVSQRSVRQRVAETLLMWSQTYGVLPNKQTIDLRLTRIEFARLLGTTPESVSRNLFQLRREGMITVRGRSIGILDRKSLARAADVQD